MTTCTDENCACWMFPEDADGFHAWSNYWDSLGADGRAQELAMMDDYTGGSS